jgi:membrane-anchored protein YejM (alkaline phosphatase superfamily)
VLVASQRVGTLCSQIDYAPTLLGLLNWSYPTRFFGKDILKMQPEDERAFIGTYQKLGLLTENRLVVLKPMREHALYAHERGSGDLAPVAEEDELTRDGIAYYQAASHLFRNGLQRRLPNP